MLIEKRTKSLYIYMSVIMLTLAMPLMFGFNFYGEEKPEEFVYILRTSLDKEASVEDFIFDAFQGGVADSSLREEIDFSTTLVNAEEWNEIFNSKRDFPSKLTASAEENPEGRKNGKYLLIKATSEENSNFYTGAKFELTGFTLKGDSYELTIGPTNSFSWDSNGWISVNSDSFVSGPTWESTKMFYLLDGGKEIYIQLFTDESVNENQNE